ncbi:dehydrogenase [Paenibacillus xerothermodurans]|uniref:Dehydrogenase n=1 Tax=Paenibacillus xerothermodurans TaxID=1977292 RepID=A0A2W1N9U4_PAEXE|nr:dehydrogenase [Paenibacillus xerothermodurans]PZE20704.1 dehydrogenase [Paenibacillus xerothermodurans]
MHPLNKEAKHKQQLPTARKIRRSCSRELYRTRKKLNKWISPELVEQAEQLYFKKVCLNLLWIVEHGSNRKLLSDWWEENVCPELAELWAVEPARLAKAFRESFGG